MRNGFLGCTTVALLALSGCATADKKASCPLPEGTGCLSAPEVYSRTNFSGTVSAVAPAAPEVEVANEPAQVMAIAPVASPKPVTGPVGPVAYRPHQYARLETQGDTLVVSAPAKAAAPVVAAPLAAAAPVVMHRAVSTTSEPHREPARVMKIRIGAWEDENGSLHGRSDVFTEIEPRRWSVGARATEASPGFRLLEGFGQGAAKESQPAAGAAAAGSRPGE